MPNRILREGILTSQPVCSLGWPEEVFYRRLMHIVDDFGRCEAFPQLLRAKCYPLQTDQVRVADITRWIAACVNAGLIVVYEADDKGYLQIVKFGQQQRTPSKYPAPPLVDINCSQAPANAHLGVSVFGGVSEGVGVVAPKRSTSPRKEKPQKTQIPDDFAASEHVIEWAQEKGFDRVGEHAEAFVRKCKAKGYEYADFDLALMEAIREDWAKLRGRNLAGSAPPSEEDQNRKARIAAERTQSLLRQQEEHAAEAERQRLARLAKRTQQKAA